MWLKIHPCCPAHGVFAIAFPYFIHGLIQVYLFYGFFKQTVLVAALHQMAKPDSD